MRHALWLVLVLLLHATAWGATYTVSTGGNDSSCSNIRTIRFAINNCARNPGDIVDIRGGSYPEQLHGLLGTSWASGSSGNPIIIRGHAGETVTLNPSTSGDHYTVIYLSDVSWITFDNLTIDGSNLNINLGMQGIKPDTGTDHITIQNCRIHHFNPNCELTGEAFENCGGGMGIQGAGANAVLRNNEIHHVGYGVYLAVPNGLFEGNYIHDTLGFGFHIYAGGCSNCSQNMVIRNNHVDHGGQDPFPDNGTGCGMVFASGGPGFIYNNLFTNHEYGCGIQLYGSSFNVQVTNNTIVGNVGACMEVSSSGHNIRNNICYANGNDITGSGSATIVENWPNNQNPQFANLSAGDYHLQGGSQAINFGHIQPGVTVDKDNNMRGSSGAVGWPTAAGAYEFGTGFTPTKGTFFIAPAPSGNDANDCEAAKGTLAAPSTTPKRTLNAALACGAAESTFVLRAGTYVESIDTASQTIPPGTSFANPTTIMAMTGETVTLQRASAGEVIFLRNGSTDQYIVFNRLILDAASITGAQGLVLYPGANHIRFQNGEIKGNWYEAVFAYNANNLEVLNSTLRQSGSGVTAVVRMTGTSTVSLQGNTIMQGAKEGVRVESSSASVVLNANSIHDNAGVGIAVNGSPGLLVSNNLLYDNARGMDVETGASATEVYNNTLWSNTGIGLQILAGASGTLSTNNLFWQNGTDTPSNAGTGTISTTNLVGNPTFVAPGPPTTFHVSGLNAVGAGTVLAKVTTDYAGVGRTPPYNTIGAYEEGAPTPPGPQPGPEVRGRPYATTHFFSY
jgi:parallel beta-helix repeat protein